MDPDNPWTYAHEAGHLMGLDDDNEEQKGGYTRAKSGHTGHMMADVMGTVQQHEIEEILKGVDCPCSKPSGP